MSGTVSSLAAMSVISLVIDKSRIRSNSISKLKIVRIIIAYEDAITNEVTVNSKYIYYPLDEFEFDSFCYNFNGITGHTIATSGEKYSTVIDWARAAAHGRQVVVCSTTDLVEVLGTIPCHVVDLHDFFFSKIDNRIEPISLGRVCSRFFGDVSWTQGRRDAYKDCKSRLAMFHMMKAFKAINLKPPFSEDFIPKINKLSKRPDTLLPKEKLRSFQLSTTLRSGNNSNASTAGDEDDDGAWFNASSIMEDDRDESAKESAKGMTRQATFTNLTIIDKVPTELQNMNGSRACDSNDRCSTHQKNQCPKIPDECGSTGQEMARGGMSHYQFSYERLLTRSDDRLSQLFNLTDESECARSSRHRHPVKRYVSRATNFIGQKCQAILLCGVTSSLKVKRRRRYSF